MAARAFRSLLAWSLIAAAPAAANPRIEADAIFVNGNVITMTQPTDRAEAIAVRDGRIVAIGTVAEVETTRTDATRRIDLKGRTVLPGFIDAHGHITEVARWLGMAHLAPPPVGTVSGIADLQAVLRDYAQSHPDGWLVAAGYDDAQLAERRHPTRQELDAVSTDRPIMALHVSGHLATLNTKALDMSGLLHPGKDAAGGMVRMEADGRTASGVIEEGAMFKVMLSLPRPSAEQQVAAMKAAQDIYARNGLTTAQDGATTPDAWAMLQAVSRQGGLFIDVHALPLVILPFPGIDAVRFNAPYEGRLRAAGVKIVLDGSPQGRTAWLSQHYHVAPAGRAADYAGYQQISDDQLKAMLRTAAAHGRQVYAHVNGDAAIQQLIDGVRAVNGEGGATLKRTIAIHSQTARLDQLQAMKQLDIEPTFFASHTYYWGDWHREVTLGPIRADRISPQRDAFDAGLRPTIHNDSPVVPPDMIRLIWSAVTRRTRSHDILGPAERVSVYEALQEVTSNAAYEIHEEGLKGTLEPGKLADFVILDGDPLAIAPEDMLGLHVVATVKEGRFVFGD
jgi:predicted amidohydrolase YtcJ